MLDLENWQKLTHSVGVQHYYYLYRNTAVTVLINLLVFIKLHIKLYINTVLQIVNGEPLNS